MVSAAGDLHLDWSWHSCPECVCRWLPSPSLLRDCPVWQSTHQWSSWCTAVDPYGVTARSATMRGVRTLKGPWWGLRRTREETTHDETINAWMVCATLLLLGYKRLSRDALWQVSWVRAQSKSVQCHVPWSMACFVPRPYHNQRVWCLTFCRQRVLVPSRNLAGTTLLRNRLLVAKVTV